MVTRKETSSAVKIIFSFVKVIDKIFRYDTMYSEISDELSDFKNDNSTSLVETTLTEKQQLSNQTDQNTQLMDKSAKSQDFFQDNNSPGKNTLLQELEFKPIFFG